MILAAGLGSRMQPLTAQRPKPALPILDRPMLRGLVEQLAAQGVTEVIVNAHAYPDQLRAALESAPIPASFSIEPAPLGSGGGIAAVRDRLRGSGSFLVVNGDMLLDLDVTALLDAHRESGSLVTLALRDDPRKADFGTIGFRDGYVTRITELFDQGSEVACGLFIGVHAMEPEIFEHMPKLEKFESLPDVYIPMLRRGEAIGAWLQDSTADWTPIGTPRELLDANLAAAARQNPDAVWIGAGAQVPASARLGPRAVIGAGARVPDDAIVRDALLLPRAQPPTGARLEGAIAYDTEVWLDD
jgi:NDP-sugar pyrophosphorylase family protein